MIAVAHEIRFYAHRGCSALLPENTIAAFQRALADGANALEMDVRCTRDGHFVVCHDCNGRRMAGVDSKVSETPLQKIKQWDVGAGYLDRNGNRSQAGCGHTIPTLEEVLCELPEVPMSIDLKQNDANLVEPLLELIAHHSAEHRITLASFHGQLIRKVRRLGYSGRTALTRREVLLARLLPLIFARRHVVGQAAQVPIKAGWLRLDSKSFVGRCSRLGIRLDFWVVNEPQQAVRLLHRGATGIMTDDPGRIVSAVLREGAMQGFSNGSVELHGSS
jgi:glycerophosphoryl diester phosphodiesterase